MHNTYSFPDNFKVTHHTDHVAPGSIFYAYAGKNHDGKLFIKKALEKGAKKIVSEEITDTINDQKNEIITLCKEYNAEIIFSSRIKEEFAIECSKAYNNPAEKLIIIGITGTKGKTTTALLCGHILREAGLKVGILCSVHNDINGRLFKTDLTTQHADYLHSFFDECIKQNITHVVMEVAAQAVSLKRSYGILFDVLIFTNFSHEHGEFYSNQKDYFLAKCSLFYQLKNNGIIITNQNNEYTKNINFFDYCNPKEIITCGSHNSVISWHKTYSSFAHLSFILKTGHQEVQINCSSLCGEHNIENICMAYATTKKIIPDLSDDILQKAIESFTGAPGRCQRYITENEIYICIDYAHTPSSFESTLKTLSQYTDNFIVIFGCGGERDHHKRPIMGGLAEKYAHEIFITLDNPRNESFSAITLDILKGCSFTKPIHIYHNRTDAIQHALLKATKNSIVALLAKGCEEYQIIGNEKFPYSEENSVKQYVQTLTKI